MSNAYYSLQFTTQGTASTTAYYYVTVIGTASQFDGGAVSIYPTAAQSTWVSAQSTSFQFQAPSARLSAGITVVTPNQEVTGTIGVSPAINVDAVLSIYGAGNQLGSVTLKAGETSMPFHFDVPSGSGMDQDQAQKIQQKVSGRPE
jgi:hypothetical protein